MRRKILPAWFFKTEDENRFLRIVQFYQFEIVVLVSNEMDKVGWFISINERQKHFLS